MSLLNGLLDPHTHQPRNRLFWVIVGGVIVAQLIALWMLCNHQVSQAEVRQAQLRSQQVAMAECLRDVPGSNRASCNGRIARDNRVPVQLDRIAVSTTQAGTVPVVYTR
ncbi:MAG: hypothetical protein HY854_03195 [Burkholderiales bacterium]|nr:hypothetical protein [Burkholderiales bacterium]